MKIKRWKLFFDYEKEEKWLNKKTAEGLAMTHYHLGCYTFEECLPGEYIYRIELLKNPVNNPTSIEYIQFMEDSGIEHIASYLNWVYFRRKATEGPFEIYSNLESRIQHYKRVVRLWIFIGSMILFSIVAQIPSIFDFIENGFPNAGFHLALYSVLVALLLFDIIIFFRFFPKYVLKVKILKRDRDIRE